MSEKGSDDSHHIFPPQLNTKETPESCEVGRQAQYTDDASKHHHTGSTSSKGFSFEEDDDDRDYLSKLKKKRRKHTNSKNGCSICKQRKIKCDERLPICSFCEKRNLECSYLTITPFQAHKIIESYATSKKKNYKEENTTAMHDLNYKYSPPNGTAKDSKDSNNSSSGNNSNTPASSNNSDIVYDVNDPSIIENGFGNHPLSEINLNSGPIKSSTSVYKAHEIEGLMLPQSMRKNATTKDLSPSQQQEYIRMTTHYLPEQQHNTPNHVTPRANSIPLYSNAKISNRTFSISHAIITKALDELIRDTSFLIQCLFTQDYASLGLFLNGRKLDSMLNGHYYQALNISQLCDTLLRKSFLLLSMDYYKNTLLKQRILPRVNYKAKISISCECENSSVTSIDEITSIIKTDYLPYFHEFSMGLVNRFAGCFFVLNDCLGYHFKNGLKYDMNLEDGKNAVKLVGIFFTGLYSIIMERSRAEILMSGTNIISAHLITIFKRVLIKGYSVKILDEFRTMVERFSNQFGNNVDYENLKLFCEKHSKLLSLNNHEHSLLGYNNGYLIRVLNSFESIVPFDAYNLSLQNIDKFKGRETDILIYLFYYALGYILDGLIPGIETASTASFRGTGWNMRNFDNIQELIQIIKQIDDKKLQLVGIYLIRTIAFFKNRRYYYQNYLSTFTIDDLLDENDDLTIDQRYLRLKEFKEDGIMKEVQMKSLLIDKGHIIRSCNYPTVNGYYGNNDEFNAANNNNNNNRLINHFMGNENLLIEDFFENNNGFFSLDYDASMDLSHDKSIAQEAAFIDGFQMKFLWKLTTYIRINNL